MHVQRMMAYLEKDDYILYNTSPNVSANSFHFYGKYKLILLLSFLFKKFRLIHHHSPNKFDRLFLCFLGYFKNNIYLHIHGASIEENFLDKSISSFLLKKTLKNVNVIADNSKIISIVKPLNPRTVFQIDAFLPPIYKKNIYASFIDNISLPKAKITIGMVGWFTEFRNTDLYGFDLALDALYKLRNEHHLDIAILASVNGVKSDYLYNQFTQNRSELNLNESFFLIMDDLEEIWPLYLTNAEQIY